MVDKRELLIGKLNSLIGQLDECCKCPDSGIARYGKPPMESASKGRRQEFTTPGFPCPASATRAPSIPKRRPWRDITPPRNRSVPFEVDWSTAPLITTNAVRETRFVSNKFGLDPRVDVNTQLRPWLPPPVDLGGNGKPWDLRRYPSRELLTGQMLQGCDCLKRNGLQDQCPRVDCRGGPACLQNPPVCKPSGGSAPEGTASQQVKDTKHKKNCWCSECRPSCIPLKRELADGHCPGCVGRLETTCGSSCQHYCEKHMAGTRAIEIPPIMV